VAVFEPKSLKALPAGEVSLSLSLTLASKPSPPKRWTTYTSTPPWSLPLPLTLTLTCEVGRLYVKGSMMSQYKGDEKKTKEAFITNEDGEWVTVGDMAYIDKEGFIFLCDREDDMIISGGHN